MTPHKPRRSVWLWSAACVLGAIVLLAVGAYLRAGTKVWYPAPVAPGDYLEALRAEIAPIPESDRAWPLLRRAVLAMDPLPRGSSTDENGYACCWWQLENERPGHERWPQLVEYLNNHQHVLALAREASTKPRLGHTARDPLDYEVAPAMEGVPAHAYWHARRSWVPMPALSGYWSEPSGAIDRFADLLEADALLASSAGDFARCVENLRAWIRLEGLRADSVLSGNYSGLTWRLYGLPWTIESLAFPSGGPSPDSDTLRRLQSVLEDFNPTPARTLYTSAVRRRIELWCDRYYTTDGTITFEGIEDWASRGSADLRKLVNDRLKPRTSTLMPLALMVLPSRSEFLDLFDDLCAEEEKRAATPLAKRPQDWRLRTGSDDNILDASGMGVEPYEELLLSPRREMSRLVPELTGQAEKLQMEIEALVVAIALELHYRDHGAWPGALRDLVPAYLHRVPIDRISGAEIGYAPGAGRPVLYSVGADRDDDGGRLPIGLPPHSLSVRNQDASRWMDNAEYEDNLKRGFLHTRYNGDWILWPRR